LEDCFKEYRINITHNTVEFKLWNDKCRLLNEHRLYVLEVVEDINTGKVTAVPVHVIKHIRGVGGEFQRILTSACIEVSGYHHALAALPQEGPPVLTQ